MPPLPPTVRPTRWLVLFSFLALACLPSLWAGPAEEAPAMLKEAGVTGGLIVHVGCGDGTLTTALRADESYVVHGLDTNPANVRQARQHIRKSGLYGPVSVARFDGKRLPYADAQANLLVAEELGGVSQAEAMRVVVPGGVLCVRQDGRWVKTVKPRPANTDEWTHALHDASGNAVAHDQVVGPPRTVQWIADPRHARSHEHTASITALVSAGGRIFYVADEGPIASLRRTPQWHVVARDAHNGLLLWKRPFTPWYPHIINWCQNPPNIHRRLVAAGGRVYVTLGFHAPLTAIDAATGDVVQTYEKTRGTEEVLCHQGVLLLLVRSVTDERIAELAEWSRLVKQPQSPVYKRESAEPLVKRLRSLEWKAPTAIRALDPDTGRLLWEKTGPDGRARPNTLCSLGDRVFYHNNQNVVCVDLKTGAERWTTPAPSLRVVANDTVVCGYGKKICALSAETGKTLWTQKPLLTSIRDVFVIKGTLWLGGFKPMPSKRSGAWGPYFATQRDLATGEVLKHIEPENPGHHHRCWSNKATDRYILGGRRGVEFIDLKTGEVRWHSWVRGVCRYGIMPANGLLYAPPHACGCYIAAKLDGFHALSAAAPAAPSDAPALTKGPQYPGIEDRHQVRPPLRDWPTYRRDSARSGATPSPVSATVKPKWRRLVGGRLSSLTVAEGTVFVASVDEHRVTALDAATGAPRWDFTADGRVDSPPTLYKGRALFGSRDGHVYSVRASDGALAWRLRAAATGRRIAVRGQLESPSPVHGSVLIHQGNACVVAGRSSYLDGGLALVRVQPQMGSVLSRTPIHSPNAKTGRQPAQTGPSNMPGVLNDILTSDLHHIYLRETVFDSFGRLLPKGDPHLLTLTGFLDDTWPHRSYWIFGTRCSISIGCGRQDRNIIAGRLLVHTPSAIYGYGRSKLDWSNALQDGPYRLFALNRAEGKRTWTTSAPIRVRAMLLADKVLFAAGPLAAGLNSPDGPGKNHDSFLLALSASDGRELARTPLPAAPIFDGMAAADDRLFLSLESGAVLCLGE